MTVSLSSLSKSFIIVPALVTTMLVAGCNDKKEVAPANQADGQTAVEQDATGVSNDTATDQNLEKSDTTTHEGMGESHEMPSETDTQNTGVATASATDDTASVDGMTSDQAKNSDVLDGSEKEEHVSTN